MLRRERVEQANSKGVKSKHNVDQVGVPVSRSRPVLHHYKLARYSIPGALTPYSILIFSAHLALQLRHQRSYGCGATGTALILRCQENEFSML